MNEPDGTGAGGPPRAAPPYDDPRAPWRPGDASYGTGTTPYEGGRPSWEPPPFPYAAPYQVPVVRSRRRWWIAALLTAAVAAVAGGVATAVVATGAPVAGTPIAGAPVATTPTTGTPGDGTSADGSSQSATTGALDSRTPLVQRGGALTDPACGEAVSILSSAFAAIDGDAANPGHVVTDTDTAIGRLRALTPADSAVAAAVNQMIKDLTLFGDEESVDDSAGASLDLTLISTDLNAIGRACGLQVTP